MTLDKQGKNIPLPAENITQKLYTSNQEYIAPVIKGNTSDKVERKEYTEAEMSSISQTIDKPKGNTSKSSKTA